MVLWSLLLACASPARPTPADELGWLVGDWVHADGTLVTTERWSVLPDGSLLGSGTLLDGPRFVAAESMAIVDDGEAWAFVAWPQGLDATRYAVQDHDGQTVTFGRAEPTFPQRIRYQRSEDGTLSVQASGVDAAGEARQDDWTLTLRP